MIMQDFLLIQPATGLHTGNDTEFMVHVSSRLRQSAFLSDQLHGAGTHHCENQVHIASTLPEPPEPNCDEGVGIRLLP